MFGEQNVCTVRACKTEYFRTYYVIFFDNMPDNLPPIINCVAMNRNMCKQSHCIAIRICSFGICWFNNWNYAIGNRMYYANLGGLIYGGVRWMMAEVLGYIYQGKCRWWAIWTQVCNFRMHLIQPDISGEYQVILKIRKSVSNAIIN